MSDYASIQRARRNRGPQRRGLCRIRHSWRISSVNLSGHQSNRERICMRDGCSAKQRQRRGYHGGKGGPWVWWPRALWCNHGTGGGPIMAAPEEPSYRTPWCRSDPNEDRSHLRYGPLTAHCTRCARENGLP